MVMRANASYGELVGHVASYALPPRFLKIGFNHFLRGTEGEHGGDVVSSDLTQPLAFTLARSSKAA